MEAAAAAGAVGGRLDDDLGVVQVGDRVAEPGHVHLCIFPERKFGEVRYLGGVAPADVGGAGGRQLVAAVELVEDQLFRVRRAGGWRERVVPVIALDHLEQIVRRLLLVRDDEGGPTEVDRRDTVKARADVS